MDGVFSNNNNNNNSHNNNISGVNSCNNFLNQTWNEKYNNNNNGKLLNGGGTGGGNLGTTKDNNTSDHVNRAATQLLADTRLFVEANVRQFQQLQHNLGFPFSNTNNHNGGSGGGSSSGSNGTGNMNDGLRGIGGSAIDFGVRTSGSMSSFGGGGSGSSGKPHYKSSDTNRLLSGGKPSPQLFGEPHRSFMNSSLPFTAMCNAMSGGSASSGLADSTSPPPMIHHTASNLLANAIMGNGGGVTDQEKKTPNSIRGKCKHSGLVLIVCFICLKFNSQMCCKCAFQYIHSI